MPFFGAKAKVRTQIDTRALASLRKLNLSAQNANLTVGFHDDAGTYDQAPESKGKPVSVAEVALWAEYGTSRTVARPFFYPALRNGEKAIAKMQATVMAAIIAKKETLLHGLSRIGLLVQIAIQNQLKLGEFAPLSDNYLSKRKAEYPGSGDRPLIRSGLLLRSVRFKASVDGKQAETPESSLPALIPSSEAIAQAKADLKRRREQVQKAKADPISAQKSFDAQRRAFLPRKP